MNDEARGPDLFLPAAVLRLWGNDEFQLGLAEEAARDPALPLLAPGLVAVLPGPGRPDVFDRALGLGRRLIEVDAGSQARRGPRHALIAAARVRVGGRVEPVADEVFALLGGVAPTLAPDVVHATAHAARGLERIHMTRAAGGLTLPSGRRLPILTVGDSDPQAPPWRHREVLGRELRWIPRVELEAQLAHGLRSERLLRVVGPLGVGKTRLAATVIKSRGIQPLWLDAAHGRRALSVLVRELDREVKTPRWLVVDSLESAGADFWRDLAEITRRPDLSTLRWLLIGREPLPWPPQLASTPAIVLPTLDPEAGTAIATQLFAGLSLPDRVADSLLETTAGNPLALEESVISMARDRQLRQVLGSFFYRGGPEPSPFHPTPRFAFHVESELKRLGAPTAARALATISAPVPVAELRIAARASGAANDREGWERPYLAAGMFEVRSGPWGEGVAWTTPALRLTVESTLAPESRKALAGRLGAALGPRNESAAQNWSAYPLLAGTSAGARALLGAMGAGGGSREELLAALLVELRAARESKPRNPALELDLLWALLPLGRRLGRLHELREMIDRAVLLAEDRSPDRLLAFAAIQAELFRNAGKLAEAEAALKRALAVARGSDERRQGPILLELARLLAQRDRFDEARSLLTKTLAAAERKRRTGLAASCRFQLGNLGLAAHDLDQARELHQAALAERRRTEMPTAIIQSLSALGNVAFQEGNYPQALERHLEAREIAIAHRLDREEAFAQLGTGRALSRLGDDLEAAVALRRALALREGRDEKLGEAIARLAVATIHLRLEQTELASREARRASFEISLLPAGGIRADAEQLLGRIALRQRRIAEAAMHLSEAQRLHREAGDGEAMLTDLGLGLRVALASGDADDVLRAFDALAAERERRTYVLSDDLLQFDLFLGARWLAERGVRVPEPLPFLQRAYQELLRKTSFLEPALRQRFLRIPEHQAIVDAATVARLPWPAS